MKLWHAATLQELVSLKGFPWAIWRVAFSSDGRTLAASGQTGLIVCHAAQADHDSAADKMLTPATVAEGRPDQRQEGQASSTGASKERGGATGHTGKVWPQESEAYIKLGNALKDKGTLDEAVAAYDQAIATLKNVFAKEPQQVQAREFLHYAQAGRAEVLCGLGRFKQAEQTYQEVLELDPSDDWSWFCDAPLRLQLGDVEGYRRVCREMLARFSQTDCPAIAHRTAKTCLFVPDAVSDLGPVLQLADRAVTGTEQHIHYRWFLLVRGMADYRAGHFADAIDRLNKTLSLQREQRYHENPYLPGTAHLFLAMAHHRLGQAHQARQALDQAMERMGQKYPKIDGNKILTTDWHDWLRFHLVRREAELLLRAAAPDTKK